MLRPLTAPERLLRTAIRVLGTLPEAVQRVIAGKPVEVDGQRLATEVQLALRLLNAIPGNNFTELPLAQARAQVDSETRIFGGIHSVRHVEDLTIPTRSGSLAARRYLNPLEREATGTLIYFHGGGWVLGSIDSADSVCRFIAERTTLEVISVDYRLAPEHRFPAAVEDAVDAYRWVRQHRGSGTVVVAGDSAGGNLSAVTCLSTLDDPLGAPDFQLLFFPATDLAHKHRSYELFSSGYFLTEAQMDWYREQYLDDQRLASDPCVSPLRAARADLARLPAAHVVVCGFDVLRDEGIAYAHRLQQAGVPVTLQLVEGHIHAFVNATGVGRLSSRALAESLRALESGIR